MFSYSSFSILLVSRLADERCSNRFAVCAVRHGVPSRGLRRQTIRVGTSLHSSAKYGSTVRGAVLFRNDWSRVVTDQSLSAASSTPPPILVYLSSALDIQDHYRVSQLATRHRWHVKAFARVVATVLTFSDTTIFHGGLVATWKNKIKLRGHWSRVIIRICCTVLAYVITYLANKNNHKLRINPFRLHHPPLHQN